MNRLNELTAERRQRYERTMARYRIKQAGDCGFALVDMKQKVPRGWFSDFMGALDRKLTIAEHSLNEVDGE